MNHGVVEQIGTPIEVYVEPATLFVARFVGQMNLIQARADERPGWAQAGGVRLRHRPGAPVTAGTAVTLGIRPEEVAVGLAARGGDNAVAARIDAVLFMGAFARLGLVAGGGLDQPLECDVPVALLMEEGLKEGAEVPVALRPEALRIFPSPGRIADSPPR
jgi:iron(III) transport system ATP-binding protein